MALFVAKNWIPRCEPKKMTNVRCEPTFYPALSLASHTGLTFPLSRNRNLGTFAFANCYTPVVTDS